MMTQTERRLFLIEYLLSECGERICIPADEYNQKWLLRSLFNIRMPRETSGEFLQIQDEHLQEESRRKGITDIADLEPIQDIQYLLFLQNIREATGGGFDEFFNALSKFAVDILPFLPYIIFWCVDKKWGYRFMITEWLGEMVNGIIKLTVCAYRPWIRSPEVNPAGDSKTAATGYSFPSGHSVKATIHYGNTAVWQWGRRKWLSIVCIVLILLTGFSRNFLGVHTPQDVIVGVTEGIVLIVIVGIVSKKLEGKEKAKDILTFIGILAIVGTLLYISLKSYPMDYDAEGKLLVDPQKMMNDCFKACGGFLGFLIGSFIERHYIRFEIPSGSAKLPILACVGFALMFAWKELFAPATIVPLLGGHWGNFVARCLMVLFALIVWPLVIRKACAEKE